MDQGAGFDVLFTDAIMPGGINGLLLAVEIDNRRPGTLHVGIFGERDHSPWPARSGASLLSKPSRKVPASSALARQFAHRASNASMNERSHRPSRMACIVASSRAR
jgi:hypothetical protein